MTLLPALIALMSIVLGGLGLRDLLRDEESEKGRRFGVGSGRNSASTTDTPDHFGIGDRIQRAGLAGALDPRAVLIAKLAGAAGGLMSGSVLGGVLPGRLAQLVIAAMAVGGFIAPDLMLERSARRRHRRMVTALPDVLDLLAVSVQTGKGLGGCLVDLSSSGRGPLVSEMARAGEDMAWGSGQALALEGLRNRIGGPEITSFVSTLERSRKLGSPLADQLRRQSATLRQDQRRAIEEEAARAAPKIQLVIALVLVPSVLLLIVAALAANADSLINVGY